VEVNLEIFLTENALQWWCSRTNDPYSSS